MFTVAKSAIFHILDMIHSLFKTVFNLVLDLDRVYFKEVRSLCDITHWLVKPNQWYSQAEGHRTLTPEHFVNYNLDPP